MARLVKNWNEMKDIFDELNRNADDYSLPVRGMLQFVLNGKLSTGKLFVNNDRSAVAVLHELSEYSPFDGDTVTVYVTNTDLFRPFFQRVSEERRWSNPRRILEMAFVRPDLKEMVKSILPDRICTDSAPIQLQNVPRSAKDVAVILPPGFRMAPGKKADAQEVSDSWEYPVEYKLERFQWMLEKFPSVTIRDSDDKPVAWTLTYSYGGSLLYVKSAFRRRHFGRAITAEVCRQHALHLPCPRYAAIVPTNRLSMAFSAENTDVLVCWLSFRSESSIAKM